MRVRTWRHRHVDRCTHLRKSSPPNEHPLGMLACRNIWTPHCGTPGRHSFAEWVVAGHTQPGPGPAQPGRPGRFRSWVLYLHDHRSRRTTRDAEVLAVSGPLASCSPLAHAAQALVGGRRRHGRRRKPGRRRRAPRKSMSEQMAQDKPSARGSRAKSVGRPSDRGRDGRQQLHRLPGRAADQASRRSWRRGTCANPTRRSPSRPCARKLAAHATSPMRRRRRTSASCRVR